MDINTIICSSTYKNDNFPLGCMALNPLGLMVRQVCLVWRVNVLNAKVLGDGGAWMVLCVSCFLRWRGLVSYTGCLVARPALYTYKYKYNYIYIYKYKYKYKYKFTYNYNCKYKY